MSHLTFDDLMGYADTGSLNPDAERHRKECHECQQRIRDYGRFEYALRRIPLERTPAGLTHRVLDQLGISESDSVLWSLLKNLAPLIAMALITAVLYGVLSLMGVFEDSDVGQSLQATQSLYRSAGEWLSSGIAQFNGWVAQWLPVKATPGTTTLVIFLILFFSAVALLDKYLFAPMLRRRMSQ